jgi:deoxyribonuclease V
MLACVDVDYRTDHAIAAGLTFANWSDSSATATMVARIDDVEPYTPGQFYKRELPCLLEVLRPIAVQLDVVIVDGYVWLGAGHPGLGAHLYEALARQVVVIGVAKTHFNGRPLYVTSAGIDAVDAAAHVRSMHGAYRLPTLLKLVDRACREG